ncbi:MAG: uL30 family ribosomal protein [Nitrososphaerales archaeon]
MQKSSTTAKDQAGSLLVVNLRGLVNTRAPVRTTLEQLSLIKRFNSTIVPDNKVFRGMLKLSKEHVAWCTVDASTVEKLLKARAEVSDGKRFDEANLKKFGYSSYSQLASDIASGKARLDGSQGIRRFFRLNSPRGGFKRSIRRQYGEGGILGPNKELAELVEKML